MVPVSKVTVVEFATAFKVNAVDAAALPVIESKIIMAPSVSVELSAEKLKSFLKFVDVVEDNDDVQSVYANYEVSDALVAKFAGS